MKLYTSELSVGEDRVPVDHIEIGEEGNRVQLDCVGGKYRVYTESPPVIEYAKLSEALRALSNLVRIREDWGAGMNRLREALVEGETSGDAEPDSFDRMREAIQREK